MKRWMAVSGMVAAMAFVWGQPGWSDQDDPRLDMLFEQLAATDDVTALRRIELSIWQLWLASGDETLDDLMRRGIEAMGDHDYGTALVAFNTIIEAAPDFAEGWNKRATLYWLMGQFEASVADIDRTLALEPRHFGALSGLAMIRIAQERLNDAYRALKRMQNVHPNSPGVRSRLERLERLLGPET